MIPDTPQKHAQYEEQVIRTFYISHANVDELSQLIGAVIRMPQMAVQPTMVPNTTGNTITVRATTGVMSINERMIASNDKPRAEIVVDIEILEVNRGRVKEFGLNLGNYALGGIFSPEVGPTKRIDAAGRRDLPRRRSTSIPSRKVSVRSTSTPPCRRRWCGFSKPTARRSSSPSRSFEEWKARR